MLVEKTCINISKLTCQKKHNVDTHKIIYIYLYISIAVISKYFSTKKRDVYRRC